MVENGGAGWMGEIVYFAANATGSSMQQTYPQTVPSHSTPRGISFREMCRCKASGHSEAQRRARPGRLYASMNKRREHSAPCKRENLFSKTPKRNCYKGVRFHYPPPPREARGQKANRLSGPFRDPPGRA